MQKRFSGKKKQREWRSRGAVLRYSPSCSDWDASSPPAGGERARGLGLLPWLPSPPARLELHPAGTWPPQSHPHPRLLLLLLPPAPPPALLSLSMPGRSPLAFLGRSFPSLLLFLLCLFLSWLLPPLPASVLRGMCGACVHMRLSSPLALLLVPQPADHCSPRFWH